MYKQYDFISYANTRVVLELEWNQTKKYLLKYKESPTVLHYVILWVFFLYFKTVITHNLHFPK